MITEQNLRSQLLAIAEQDFRLPSASQAMDTARSMLQHIGALDSELRDRLIYRTFSKWILGDAFSPAELREIAETALDEHHLFYRIGEQETDSVFTRSFSALLLALIVIEHRQRPFLNPAALAHMRDRMVVYLARERDRRGYVAEKGWAHAVAHAADVLDEFVQCVEFGAADVLAILAVVQEQAATEESVYIHEEDERLSVIITNALQRDIVSPEDLHGWLHRWVELAAHKTSFPAEYYRFINIKNVLQSLYFRCQRYDVAEPFRSALAATLDAVLKVYSL